MLNVVGLALLLVTTTALWADRPPPQFSCSKYIVGIRCEAMYVYPIEPEWITTDGVRIFEKERGQVAFLTVDAEWRTIEMRVAGHVLRARGRLLDGLVQFVAAD